ncbi:high-potential iron-sulfur protein [Cupriavidus basilensis]
MTKTRPLSTSVIRQIRTRSDKTKYPKHEASQRCGNCYLYDGKAGAPKGDCPLFGGQVAANGWCIAWVKKA